MASSVISIRNAFFSYNGQPVLSDINLEITAGDFVAMIGPNGGGKTTLLKLILGLVKADRGSVRIFGQPPGKASHRIGYVPQDIHINKHFPISAIDVVLMGMIAPGRRRFRRNAEDREAAGRSLDQMDMGSFSHRRMGELSGGQRQRVFIARALVTRPEILVLDEPTASIDSKGQIELYRLLKELNESITIVVVSHDLMVLSSYVKSVACVNRYIHYHNEAEITRDMLESMYPCSVEDVCPVELIAHGLPHRVLKEH